jgi:4-amino-4-deoxy-L-arabinose transferase-like glycosyltransferase
LPDGVRHLAPYHPDEPLLVLQAGRMLATGGFDQLNYNYGGLQFYLDAALFWLGPKLGFLRAGQLWDYYAVARLFTLACSIALIGVAFLIGKRAYGVPAAMLAALFLALAPGFVEHSQFAMADVSCALWSALAVLCALRTLDGPGRLWPLLGCLFAGLAAGTKYNGGIVLLAVLVAMLRGRRSPWLLLLGPVVTLATFLLCNPMAVVKPHEFWSMAIAVNRVSFEGWGVFFLGLGPGYQLTGNWPFLVGWPLTLAILAALPWLCVRPRSHDLVLLAAIGPAALSLMLSKGMFMRYWLAPLPLLVLAGAACLWQLRTRWRLPGNATLGLVLASLVVITGWQSWARIRPDPRDAALVWCEANVAKGSSIGLVTGLAFYSPPLSRFNNADSQALFDHEQQTGTGRWQLWRYDDLDAADLAARQPDWFVISEFERRDIDRLRPRLDQVAGKLGEMARRRDRLLAEIDRRYEVTARFNNLPAEQRWLWSPVFAPHDWLYPFPEIVVYRRR